jgi:signal transduction histidine kinase
VTKTARGAPPDAAGPGADLVTAPGVVTPAGPGAPDRVSRVPNRGPAASAARAAARASAWYAALSARRRELVQDSALALALAAGNLLSLLPYQSQLHPLWLALFLVSVQCVPLALRRVFPVPALIVCAVPRVLYDALISAYAPLPLAPMIAFGTVADRSRRSLCVVTFVVTVGVVSWAQTLPGHHQPYDGIVQACLFGAGWAVGTLFRYRRAALAAAAERAERAEASIDAAAIRAAALERVRIARELHDVVAHHVSLMAVQAEAVGALLPARPDQAASSADLISSTARVAMVELRRLLGVLRFTGGDEPERIRLTPSPSLARLDELIDAVRDAGLEVSLNASEPSASQTMTGVPAGVDVTAYRIVQEALTNAMRHAPGSAARVRVAREPEGYLIVEVTNTAGLPVAPAVPDSRSPGFGLAGIAERVASCGGSLALGPTPDGGFTVAARLPLT